MIHAVCIGKARDKNNNITQYKLRDFTGQETIFDASALKDYISKGKISVCNLTLTSDNKLMEKKVDSLSELNAPGKVQHTNMGNVPKAQAVIPEQYDRTPKPNGVDPANAYKSGEMLYYVAQDGNLNIKHIPSNAEETITSNVSSACFIPQGHKLNIFYASMSGEGLIYKYMIYDTTYNKVLRDRKICAGTKVGYVGKMLCPTNQCPFYRDRNNDFLFVPIRAKENGGVSVVGMLAYDTREGEHFSMFNNGINAARGLSRLMGVLTHTGHDVVAVSIVGAGDLSTDLRSGGTIISLNKKLQIIECAQY